MPQTINKTENLQIIAGVFSDSKNADKALTAFQELGVQPANIQVLVQEDKSNTPHVYTSQLEDRGVVKSQASYYNDAIRHGKTYMAIHNVTDASAVIEVFDRYGAEYNPDGSRNVRQDVAGLTAGTGAGAVVGAGIGLATAGPLGAAVGAVTGAVVGAGAGAAAGKAVEHSK